MKHVRIDPGSPEEQKLLYRCGIGALIFAVLDQITKELVIEHIQMYERVPVIPGFFDLTYVTNPGAAWGIFSHRGILLIAISLIVMALMLIFLRKICDGWRERYISLALIVSGILGNTYDRFFRSTPGNLCDGQVVDFLSFYIKDIPWAVWPSFNVADSCICIGVCVFILSNFIRPDKEKPKNEAVS